MILKSGLFVASLLAMVKAETPEEAHRKLAAAYHDGDGWELHYELTKNDKKGPSIILNVTKGRQHAAVCLLTPTAEQMFGFSYHPSAGEDKATTFVVKGTKKIPVSFAVDASEILAPLTPDKPLQFFFNPQVELTRNSVNLSGNFSSTASPPYPWSVEILENIERVERQDGKVIFHGKNEEEIHFDPASGLLLMQRFPRDNNRTMTLASQRKLVEFEPERHGLKGKKSEDEEMIEMARESFRIQQTLLILKASALLAKIEPDKQGPALEAFQKNLNTHYRHMEGKQDYLCDHMGLEPMILAACKSSIGNVEEKLIAAGRNPAEFFEQQRPRVITEILAIIPQFAKRASKKNVFGINPDKFDPRDRPALELILDAERKACLRNLLIRNTNKVLDDIIGQN